MSTLARVTSGLWQSGLRDWYGPGTPIVQRVRGYRPNRRGEIKLVRWLRVGILRGLSCGAAGFALYIQLDTVGLARDRAFMCAIALAMASCLWRGSLIRVVLRPGEIVRFGVLRHVVVPCSAVKRLHRDLFRGVLSLETHDGENVDFALFDGSLWDAFYDFSSVCDHAMQAHVRAESKAGLLPGPARLRRYFTWSVVADPLAVGAVFFAGIGLYLTARG
ncbi:hypothetical protein [Streptomyces sp. MBT53]|uniref:hypothetical protein n=1 Tax=Streptomyces sp. MBT53 TaxID=1488384 RepID=UPI0027D9FB6D|nr:hypothetical protein [Streptomyces sp. MBT53]